MLLYIDANGRMDNEDAVPRLFEKALEEKPALLQELQHRVKNSLTMITSLIGIEENQASSRGNKRNASL